MTGISYTTRIQKRVSQNQPWWESIMLLASRAMILILAFLFYPVFALGYELTGSSWAHLSKPRQIKFVICDKGISTEAKKRIAEAASKWSNDEKFSISIDDTLQCDINHNWLKCQKINVIDRGALGASDEGFFDPAAAASRCTQKDDPSKQLNCDIRLSDAVKFNEGTGDPAADSFDLVSVMIHEFGHCVGLRNLQSSSNSVMYGVAIGKTKRVLDKDDKNGRDALYK